MNGRGKQTLVVCFFLCRDESGEKSVEALCPLFFGRNKNDASDIRTIMKGTAIISVSFLMILNHLK